MTTTPTVLSFVLCDAVRRDADGRAHLLGVFNGFGAAEFPATTPPAVAYLCLAGGRGEAALALRLIDSADAGEEALFAAEMAVRFAGPLSCPEVVAELPAIPLPCPGAYEWQVLHRGRVVYARRMAAERTGARATVGLSPRSA
jgi:hypothetical protein